MAFVRGANVVTDGLVLALDAANPKSYVSGSLNWRDLTGTAVTGSLINGPGFDSANGGIIQFDGINDYVVTGNSGITGNNPWSISIWVNVDISENGSGRQGWIIWEGASNQSTSELIAIGVASGVVEVAHWANDTAFGNSKITFDAFQNITITFNGITERVYINGKNTDNKNTTLNITDGAWYLATRAAVSEYLKCKISQVYIYNRAIIDSEVLQNYNATKARFGLT